VLLATLQQIGLSNPDLHQGRFALLRTGPCQCHSIMWKAACDPAKLSTACSPNKMASEHMLPEVRPAT